MRAGSMVVVAATLLAACQAKGPDNAAMVDNGVAYSQDASSDRLPSDPTGLTMKEFMGHVMQFGGDSIWKWQGFVNDETGEHDLSPKTDKDWEEAESGALTLAELTNVLMLPGRRVDDPKWDAAVARVRGVALKAAKASEKRDVAALFEIGGELDAACESCHVQFVPNYQGPPQAALGNE